MYMPPHAIIQIDSCQRELISYFDLCIDMAIDFPDGFLEHRLAATILCVFMLNEKTAEKKHKTKRENRNRLIVLAIIKTDDIKMQLINWNYCAIWNQQKKTMTWKSTFGF